MIDFSGEPASHPLPGIGKTLYLSPNTIRSHLRYINRKFNLRTRKELRVHLSSLPTQLLKIT